MTDSELVKTACEAMKKAYAPYSGFCVGAALLCSDGSVYSGCNIENSSYGAANCAERTAIFKAVSEGEYNFAAIAIVGNDKNTPIGQGDFCPPCGVCRQVMTEFCTKDFEIILARDYDDYKVYTLEQIMPLISLPLSSKK